MYLRCLLYGTKKDNAVRYLFRLYKIKQAENGKILKTVIHKTEHRYSYFDLVLIPERYPVGLGDTVKLPFILYSSVSSKLFLLVEGSLNVQRKSPYIFIREHIRVPCLCRSFVKCDRSSKRRGISQVQH